MKNDKRIREPELPPIDQKVMVAYEGYRGRLIETVEASGKALLEKRNCPR
jgi:hypothetical protein